MKRQFALIASLFFLSILLSGCTAIDQLLHPTPPPPPVAENDTWSIKIVSIEKYNDPAEFRSTNFDAADKHSFLTLQEKNTYIRLTTQIVNKSGEVQTVPDVKIGVLLNTFSYGCGGVTVGGTDYCLPSGMVRNGVNYVNYGIDTPDFNDHLSFVPNSPDGETVVFLFIIKSRSRYWDFYFDDLTPLSIKKIKPLKPVVEQSGVN